MDLVYGNIISLDEATALGFVTLDSHNLELDMGSGVLHAERAEEDKVKVKHLSLSIGDVGETVGPFSREAFCPNCLETEKYDSEQKCLSCGTTIPDGILELEEACEILEHRLVEVFDDEDSVSVFIARTSLSDKEINDAIYAEEFEDSDKDYEEKCIIFAENNGAFFERVYTERVGV